MKLIKKSFSFITAIVCCAAISSIMPFSSSAEESVKAYGDLSYITLDSDGDGTDDYAQIVDCNETAVEVDIPAEIEGLPVKSTRDWAFADCKSLTSISVPDSVNAIGNGAFSGCSSLASINIPNSVTTIRGSAFCNCLSLTSITIPESVTSIEIAAFSGCSSLTNITIPDLVASIGDHAFYNCLTSITVSENNKYFSSLNGVLFNKDKTELITYPIGNERTEYTIPDSVTSIGNFAFYNCSSLTSITIPDSVASIGNSAFYNCSSLTNIKLPDVIDIISGNTFRDCSSLLNIIIPDSVTSIKECAFYNCSNLTSITIPDSVASIENSAFYNCTSLKSITLNNPDCEISNDKDTIPETAVICGYENSTAQAYAERYYKRFVAIEDIGDISGNGKIDLYDAIEIAKAIMGMRTFTEEEKLIADFNKDVTVDLYDAIEIARTLLPK